MRRAALRLRPLPPRLPLPGQRPRLLRAPRQHTAPTRVTPCHRPRVSLRAIGRPRAPKAQAAPLHPRGGLRHPEAHHGRVRAPASARTASGGELPRSGGELPRSPTISHHLPPSPARLPRHVLLSSWTALLLVFVYTASASAAPAPQPSPQCPASPSSSPHLRPGPHLSATVDGRVVRSGHFRT